MASPRVFVSSTCYDLSEIRDGLFSFIASYGYEPVLSEKGDIFFHPDLHTHESCLQEMDNCHMMILIIGGRFGGKYVYDRNKSIVNAEYFAARECNIPVFCFVKKEVMEEHRLYEKNKLDKELIKKIVFPSVENSEYSSDIFEFINEVNNSNVNNGLFSFEYGRDIQDILKKQWAGLMFDFLLKRKYKSELEIATGLIGNLTLASKKTEELIENIYKHLDKEKAEENIAEINKEFLAKKFFQSILEIFERKCFGKSKLDKLTKINTGVEWYEFFVKTGEFFVAKDVPVSDSNRKVEILSRSDSNRGILVGGALLDSEKKLCAEFERSYQSFRELRDEQKIKVLKEYAAESNS